MLWDHPRLAARSCEDCGKYQYDENGHQVVEWDRKKRIELPVLRPKGQPTPCWLCEKVPEKIRERDQKYTTKEHAINLSPRNMKVYRHYTECKAVGRFPDDPIVTRHAGIISRNREAWERGEYSGRLDALIALVSTLRVRNG